MAYRIPAANMPRLRADLDRLNKRAIRLGLAPIGIASETIETRIVTKELGFDEEVRIHVIEITGTTPVLDGWTFIGALKHVEGKVLVKVAAGATLPDEFLSASPERCDHCHVKRARLAAFVLRHADDRTMVVGRNCLADFIRTTNPDALASQAEFLTSLDFGGYEDDDASGSTGPRGYRRINAEGFMVAVLRQIAADGRYISRRTAEEMKRNAETPAMRAAIRTTAENAPYHNIENATEDERTAARAIIEWAQMWAADADPSTDDYRFNIGVVASMEFIEERLWAIFASIPSAKARAEEKREAKAAEVAKPSEWIGTIGKREVFTLTVSRPTKTIEHAAYVGRGTDYTYLYSFETPEGFEVRYFASRPIGVERGAEAETLSPENELLIGNTRPLRVGDTIEIKATVKKHDLWHDRKQTTITRGAVVRLLAAGPVAA